MNTSQLSLLTLPNDYHPGPRCACETCQREHPDWNTPNWCPKCSPKNQGYCSCELAAND